MAPVSKIFLASVLLVSAAYSATGCFSLRVAKDQSLTAAPTSADDLSAVPFTRDAGTADYTVAGKAAKVEWLGCHVKAPRATFVLMHSDRACFDGPKFCDGWIAQAFLSKNVDVLAINRPGYGESAGIPDFAGETSMAALDSGIRSAAATSRFPKPMTTLWGYSTGATAAALYAKHTKSFTSLILGGGIYDFEETEKSTVDDYLKKDLAIMRKTGGGKALEDRSIGYDVSGLPKRIFVYHGENDRAAPFSQAKAFSDSLAGAEYKVSFEPIEGAGAALAWNHHRRIIQNFVEAALSGDAVTASPEK